LVRTLTTTGLDQRASDVKVHISYMLLVTNGYQHLILRYEFVILGIVFLTCLEI